MEEDLEKAVQFEDVEAFKLILQEILAKNISGHDKSRLLGPALLRAVRGPVGCPVMCRFVSDLLHAGADVNQIFLCSNTPLILAAERGQVEVTRLLLESGCDVNRTDTETRTALHWACMNGHAEIVQQLLDHGAHPDRKDRIYGFTPLMLAARQGHDRIVESLLHYPIIVNQRDIHAETALFDAVRNGQERCVLLLLQAGATINHCDKNGASPLLIATYYNRVSIAKMLIHWNCDIGLRGCAPYTHLSFLPPDTLIPARQDALEIAILEGKWDICKVLVTAGINAHKKIKYVLNRELIENLPIEEEKKNIPQWLIDAIIHPRPLRDIARIQIRRCLGADEFLHYVALLPLPKPMLDYLLIPELQIDKTVVTTE